MNKEGPSHVGRLSWPEIILNRQSGLFCKQNERRYLNHRKVFERGFYGSLNAVERLELMAKLNEHLGCVNSLGFSANGRYLLSGSDDLRIILWNWYNNKVLAAKNTKHKKNIFQTKFYDDTEMKAVSSSADGTISIHQFTSDGGHWEKQIYTHAGAVHKLAVAENVIYTCGEDGLIIEFDYRTKSPTKLTTVREKHRKISLFSISAHPLESSKYAVSGRDQFVRVYDRRNEKTVLARFCPQELLQRNTTIRYISCCTYNYNGSELLASYNDENIYLFDSSNHNLGTYKHKYQGHINSATIKGVNFFGPKSEYVVTGSDCSHIFFYDKEKESIVQFMRGDENGIVNVLEPHPIYPVLATSGLDKDVKIWVSSNCEFELNKENLKKCVNENMKSIYESNQTATFSLNPAIIELARRFFQRHRDPSVSPNPLPFVYRSSESSNDSD
jgi:WD repeat-containing protein 42A